MTELQRRIAARRKAKQEYEKSQNRSKSVFIRQSGKNSVIPESGSFDFVILPFGDCGLLNEMMFYVESTSFSFPKLDGNGRDYFQGLQTYGEKCPVVTRFEEELNKAESEKDFDTIHKIKACEKSSYIDGWNDRRTKFRYLDTTICIPVVEVDVNSKGDVTVIGEPSWFQVSNNYIDVIDNYAMDDATAPLINFVNNYSSESDEFVYDKSGDQTLAVVFSATKSKKPTDSKFSYSLELKKYRVGKRLDFAIADIQEFFKDGKAIPSLTMANYFASAKKSKSYLNAIVGWYLDDGIHPDDPDFKVAKIKAPKPKVKSQRESKVVAAPVKEEEDVVTEDMEFNDLFS